MSSLERSHGLVRRARAIDQVSPSVVPATVVTPEISGLGERMLPREFSAASFGMIYRRVVSGHPEYSELDVHDRPNYDEVLPIEAAAREAIAIPANIDQVVGIDTELPAA